TSKSQGTPRSTHAHRREEYTMGSTRRPTNIARCICRLAPLVALLLALGVPPGVPAAAPVLAADPTFRPGATIASSSSLTVGDFNGAGALDLVLGNQYAPSQIYLGNGQGGFSPTTQPLNPGGNVTISVVTGDFNGDGKLDLVLGNFNEPSRVYLG